MTEPVRRRLEQPSAEQAKRSGCLTWGAVLGVLVGIMLGIYALPPILKHFYGETVVAADEFYSGDGKVIRVVDVSRVGEDGAAPWRAREEFVARVVAVVEEPWMVDPTTFSLEFDGLEDWVVAESGGPVRIEPGAESELELRFVVEVPEATDGFSVQALHLSDPRVKFEVRSP